MKYILPPLSSENTGRLGCFLPSSSSQEPHLCRHNEETSLLTLVLKSWPEDSFHQFLQQPDLLPQGVRPSVCRVGGGPFCSWIQGQFPFQAEQRDLEREEVSALVTGLWNLFPPT